MQEEFDLIPSKRIKYNEESDDEPDYKFEEESDDESVDGDNLIDNLFDSMSRHLFLLSAEFHFPDSSLLR